jgi:hypothetical protein
MGGILPLNLAILCSSNKDLQQKYGGQLAPSE